jgi:hypothetical protein
MALSHLNTIGGKLTITSNQDTQFLAQYAKTVQMNQRKNTLNEIMGVRAPLFIDIDYISYDTDTVSDFSTPDTLNRVNDWVCGICETIASVIKVTESQPLQTTVSASSIEEIKSFRTNLPPDHAVVCTAPFRVITKNGKTGVKVGIHMVWPNLIIDKIIAQQLREIIVCNLYDFDGKHDWNSIIDDAVYRHNSCLRMLYSYRAKACDACGHTDTGKYNKSKAAALKYLKLPQGSFSDIRSAHDTMVQNRKIVPKSVQDFMTISAEQNCTVCYNKKKIPDIPSGFYTFESIRDAEGTILTQPSDTIKQDVFASLWVASIRRPDSTPLTTLNVSEDAPLPASYAPGTNGELQRVTFHSDEETTAKYCRVTFDVPDGAIESLQEFLRQREQWSSLQVSNLIKLSSRMKTDQAVMLDNSPDYIIVAVPRGYGANSCLIADRIHGSNHIYFVLKSNGDIVQKCHNSECKEKVHSLQQFDGCNAYSTLFPFTKKAVDVPDSEVMQYKEGKINKEIARKTSKVVLSNLTGSHLEYKATMMFKRRQEATRARMASSKKSPVHKDKKRSLEEVETDTFDFDGYN